MVKKRGLGKSLDALLSYKDTETTNFSERPASDQLTMLPIEKIQRGKYQPRREMDLEALEELAQSIRTQGIIQPLIVRPYTGNYEIIAGERRWRAAKLAGLTEVPVIIRDIPDESAIAIAIIENVQRENLNPIEEAIALERLLNEFGMTHQEVADSVGKSRTSVTNLLRLLSLPDEVKDLLESRSLEMGHARALLPLPTTSQVEVAQLIVVKGLSVRETEQLVRNAQKPEKIRQYTSLDPDIIRLQENLSRQLKLRVAIQYNAKGKGKLVIHYKNLSELDTLLSQIQSEG